mmetsp:Transcript_52058/g.59761  ORF Transcript_52058/g.59761 Transcript_52058/m.59761 type:complete len:95 (-) Transcript_52058:36-320(-)
MRDSDEQRPEDLEEQKGEYQYEQNDDDRPPQDPDNPENQENPEGEPENKGKKRKNPYELDYNKLPKGKLGRMIFEYNDFDMAWDRVNEDNQEWL